MSKSREEPKCQGMAVNPPWEAWDWEPDVAYLTAAGYVCRRDTYGIRMRMTDWRWSRPACSHNREHWYAWSDSTCPDTRHREGQ